MSVNQMPSNAFQLNVCQSNAFRRNDFRPKDAEARFEQNGEDRKIFKMTQSFKLFIFVTLLKDFLLQVGQVYIFRLFTNIQKHYNCLPAY